MSKFSIKNGYANAAKSQICDITLSIRNRIWNLFYREEITKKNKKRIRNSFKNEGLIEDILLDKAGLLTNANGLKINRLKEYFFSCEWFEVLDFVEFHIEAIKDEEKEAISILYTEIFECEGIKFRVINEKITPIYDQLEIGVIEEASYTEFASVNQHINKALLYFSDRKHPDYENSIKESISAVESMCCIINGKNETLNKALEHLKDSGVHIHPAMEKSFILLYSYTCDEKGIRHAGIEFVKSPAEDAKFMLVSCSAFINYLIQKWKNINN